MSRDCCPLCRRETDHFEFHHWDYDNDTGVELCRDCHNAIHGGEDGRVSIQDNRAKYYGLESWHDYAIGNLIERDIEFADADELPDPIGVVTPENDRSLDEQHEKRRERWGEYKQYLRERYNLPEDERLEVSGSVWGKYPFSAFDAWLRTGQSLSEAHGVAWGDQQ